MLALSCLLPLHLPPGAAPPPPSSHSTQGVTANNVSFYLAFVVDGEERMALGYAALKPTLAELVQVYTAAHDTLFTQAGGDT